MSAASVLGWGSGLFAALERRASGAIEGLVGQVTAEGARHRAVPALPVATAPGRALAPRASTHTDATIARAVLGGGLAIGAYVTVGPVVALSLGVVAGVSAWTYRSLRRSVAAKLETSDQLGFDDSVAFLLGRGAHTRRTLALITVAAVGTTAFALSRYLVLGRAIDVLTGTGQRKARQMARLAGVGLGLTVVQAGFEYVGQSVWRSLSRRLQHQLRLELYDHVQRMELSYFEGRERGALVSVLSEDIAQIDGLFSASWELLRMVANVVLVGGAFMVIAPEIAWLAILPVPVVLYAAARAQHKLAPAYAADAEHQAELSGRVAGFVDGVATIKNFQIEDVARDHLQRMSAGHLAEGAAATRLGSLVTPLMETVIMGGTLLPLAGAGLMLTGPRGAGMYAAVTMLTGQLYWPLSGLGRVVDQLQRSRTSVKRVRDLLAVEPELRTGDRPLSKSTPGRLEVRALSFAYAGGPRVLRELELTIAAGEVIALVGTTGCGKSTLLKLLSRLYEVAPGHLWLDGHDLTDLRVEDVRRAISVVSQDVFLFHASVHDNIAIGKPDATRDEVERAARIAMAHDFIAALPDGYATLLGERGQTLSGGERQRISVARAILKDAPILILDEATSALDASTELAMLDRVLAHYCGRTVVLVTHRLTTARMADRIALLQRGQVTEQGTHEALLAADGTYATLWRLQASDAGELR